MSLQVSKVVSKLWCRGKVPLELITSTPALIFGQFLRKYNMYKIEKDNSRNDNDGPKQVGCWQLIKFKSQ